MTKPTPQSTPDRAPTNQEYYSAAREVTQQVRYVFNNWTDFKVDLLDQPSHNAARITIHCHFPWPDGVCGVYSGQSVPYEGTIVQFRHNVGKATRKALQDFIRGLFYEGADPAR